MSGPKNFEGQAVSRSFTPDYIFLSYLVSYIGAWTTLELLQRRTAGRGLYNWYLLVGSSVSMGGIAIWCMHFVGNRAIVIGNGEPELQIAYSPGFTALSFFLPILVLLPAFLATDSHDQVRHVRVALCGTTAGLSICGMHYLGQLGISNLICTYEAPYVIASAVVAVVASVAALTIFFLCRAAWTNSWWKRGLCSLLLAGGVSGMHWLASVGTRYRYRDSHQSTVADSLSKKQTVIVVITLSIAACVVLSIMAIFAQRQRRTTAEHARQVVLASAIFDCQGRLLVTPEGMLPSQKLTGIFAEPSAHEVFSVSHPVFHWAFRASRNWGALTDLVPCMRHHLHDGTVPYSPIGGTALDGATARADIPDEQTIRFHEMFCVAAADLAKQVGEPLESIGCLYDDVVSTGAREASRFPAKHVLSLGGVASGAAEGSPPLAGKHAYSQSDIEIGRLSMIPQLGPGQLLFLVRRADKSQAARLQSHGYRFTSLPRIYEALAEGLQVSASEVMTHLENMRYYAAAERMLEPGVHLACFAIRASVGGSFDVLVRQTTRNLLPTRPLALDVLEDWQAALIQRLDGWTVAACLDWLRRHDGVGSEKEGVFVGQVGDALAALAEEVADPLFQQAILVGEPVYAPCRRPPVDDSYFPARATLIAFRLIVPIHARVANTRRHAFLPLNFFRCQQYAYGTAADHDVFTRRLQHDFAPVVESTTQSTVVYRSPNGSAPHAKLSARARQHRPLSWWRPSNDGRRSRQNSQVSVSKHSTLEARPWGGILVSQEVNVNVDAVHLAHLAAMAATAASPGGGGGGGGGDGDGSVNSTTLMMMESGGMLSAAVEDNETFVDRLLVRCVEGR